MQALLCTFCVLQSVLSPQLVGLRFKDSPLVDEKISSFSCCCASLLCWKCSGPQDEAGDVHSSVSDPVWPEEPVTQWAELLIHRGRGPPGSRCGLEDDLWGSRDINHPEALGSDQEKERILWGAIVLTLQITGCKTTRGEK